MQGHKNDFKCGKNVSSKQIVCYEDAKILLVETCPCNNKEELAKAEGNYIKNNECVNKYIPSRTNKEYREDNKEYVKEYLKEYYINNCETIKSNVKENKNNNIEKYKSYQKNYQKINNTAKIEYDKIRSEEIKNTPEKLIKVQEYRQNYYLENAEKKKQYQKKYKILTDEKNKEVIICECGASITRQSVSRHNKTIKHLEFIKNKTI
jgi:hypothetical protein